MRVVQLATPSLPLIVDPRSFDGFAWCPGSTLEWRASDDALALNALNDELPLRVAFVFREPWDTLPGELARLHTGRALAEAIGLGDAYALAPYAIDDATDSLWEHRRAPTDTFWLATDNLNGLYWALHDWAHFHNHGPFTDRPSTEYQCDVAALVWLWINRTRIPLPEDRWDALCGEVLANHLRLRTSDPYTHCPTPEFLTRPERLRTLALAHSVALPTL